MGTSLAVIVRIKAAEHLFSEDPYVVLGVKRRATLAAITAAYRRLARMHHPDRNGDPEAFKKVQWAYSLLRDPKQRKQFRIDGFAGVHFDPAMTGAAQELLASTFDAFLSSIEEHIRKAPDDNANRRKISLLTLQMNDPIAVMHEKFEGDIKNGKAELRKLRRVHKQLLTWAESVKHRDGMGMYDLVIKARIANSINSIKSVQEGIALHREAKRLLKDYKYTVDREAVEAKMQEAALKEAFEQQERQHQKRFGGHGSGYTWIVANGL